MGAMPRIIAIGVNKTGTGSLHLAMGVLGISSAHYECREGNVKDIIRINHENDRPLLTGLESYRAISDWNTPQTNPLFRVFDEQYPGSRFILTKRDLEPWLRSREAHVRANREKPEYRGDWLNIDRDAWTAEYHEHNAAVRDHFADRPGDLLEMDISKGDAWDLLCPFLGVDTPDVPFPHKNKSPNISRSLKRKVTAAAGRFGRDRRD